jgi:hypothetical protein
MRERYFRIGSLHGIRQSHIHAPRESGLPFDYFRGRRDVGDWVVLLLAIAIGLTLFAGWTQ